MKAVVLSFLSILLFSVQSIRAQKVIIHFTSGDTIQRVINTKTLTDFTKEEFYIKRDPVLSGIDLSTVSAITDIDRDKKYWCAFITMELSNVTAHDFAVNKENMMYQGYGFLSLVYEGAVASLLTARSENKSHFFIKKDNSYTPLWVGYAKLQEEPTLRNERFHETVFTEPYYKNQLIGVLQAAAGSKLYNRILSARYELEDMVRLMKLINKEK